MTHRNHPTVLLGLFIAALPALAQNSTGHLQTVIIASGVPLHIRVTRTAHLHRGAVVQGMLTEPIYVRDRLVLPAGSVVQGNVVAYTPIDHIEREQAVLNGDVTPLHDPVVDFTVLRLTAPAGVQTIAIDTSALIRISQLVRFSSAKKPSLLKQAIAAVKSSIQGTYETIFGPDKKDRALRLLYGQLPYHPQRIWTGTQFIADLNVPATVTLPAEPTTAESDATSLNNVTVDARLATALDSASAKKGDPLTAVLTKPVFDAGHKLILPEGAELDGLVSAAKPARSFGRNGQLRFAIRGVKTLAPTTGSDLLQTKDRKIYGTLTGAEGNTGENLTVDSEGNVKANPDKGRFVAPLLLAVTALTGAGDRDHHHDAGSTGGGVGGPTVASNGFGLIARVIALVDADRNVALGFGAFAFAKSIYFRFLIRGHEVTFAKDTQLEVTLSTR